MTRASYPMLRILAGLTLVQILACGQPTPASEVEEIYIARSVRDSRAEPSEFCGKSRTGFVDATYEDRYTLRSTITRASDGRVVDANAQTVGSIHACFGRTADTGVLRFYGEIRLGQRLEFRGVGECRQARADFPERGLNVFRCFLQLSGLPGEYTGGLLTTNSMTSLKSLGTETDPRGYVQSSIATIRLWKKRVARP